AFPSLSIILRKPTALMGAPRSLKNRYRLGSCSRCRRRKARSSLPVSGWTEGMPLLSLETCRRGLGGGDFLPPQGAQLGCPQAMPEGEQHHRRIAMPIPITTCRLHEPLDLFLGQVLPGSIMGIGEPTTANCSLYTGWRSAAGR